MTQWIGFTKEMQSELALTERPEWQTLQTKISDGKSLLLQKLMALACVVTNMHDATLDPLMMKGLCLTIGGLNKEDATSIEMHCTAVDEVLKSKNIDASTINSSLFDEDHQEIKALQLQVLSTLQLTAQNAYSAYLLGKKSYHICYFFYQVLAYIPTNPSKKELEEMLMKARGILLFSTDFLAKALTAKR